MSTDVIKYSIIATDYESYALVHGCKKHYDIETDEFKVVVFSHIWADQRHWMKEWWKLWSQCLAVCMSLKTNGFMLTNPSVKNCFLDVACQMAFMQAAKYYNE